MEKLSHLITDREQSSACAGAAIHQCLFASQLKSSRVTATAMYFSCWTI
jgi:hypothetical protein